QNSNPIPFVQAVPTPQTRTELSPRIDTQFGQNNTLTFRYQLWDNSVTNSNVGQFTLPSAGYDYHYRDQVFQVSDAQVINEKAVTEVRFRYFRTAYNQNPVTPL